MFEALRGLRDAVAPESGNLGNNNNNNNNDPHNASSSTGETPDYEELWSQYRSGDPATVAAVHAANGGVAPPQRREDFLRIHRRLEMEKDAELVTTLAGTVLQRSDDINQRVSSLPGIHRNKEQQMAYLQVLIQQNQTAAAALEDRYAVAKERRDRVRLFLKDHTCEALGIMEGDVS